MKKKKKKRRKGNLETRRGWKILRIIGSLGRQPRVSGYSHWFPAANYYLLWAGCQAKENHLRDTIIIGPRAPDYAELLFISVPFRFNWHLWPGRRRPHRRVMDILVTLWRPDTRRFHAKTDQPDVISLPKAYTRYKAPLSVVLLLFSFFSFLFYLLLSSLIFASKSKDRRDSSGIRNHCWDTFFI